MAMTRDELKKLYDDNVDRLYALTEKQRQVFTLRARDFKSFKEIGEALGITQSTANNTFCQAVKKLETVRPMQTALEIVTPAEKPKPKKVVEPPKPKDGKVVYSIRISEDYKKTLAVCSKLCGCSIGDFIIDACDEYIQQHILNLDNIFLKSRDRK